MIQEVAAKGKDWLFNNIHGNNLVYNTCWEDPVCDRALLSLNKNSEVVMITSAGCNALDYALDNPKKIHCVDVNYRQNALLELKKAFFKQTNFDYLFQFFGEGKHANPLFIYEQLLRSSLPIYAQNFWDEKIESYFVPTRLRPSFYFHSTSGTFAWLFGVYARLRRNVHDLIQELLKSPTLEVQKYWYSKVESKVIGPFVQWAMKRSMTLSLLGIPRSQSQLVEDEYPGGVARFIQDSLRHIFTELPIQNNYFWQLYINGYYTKDCCPNYLKEENFDLLHENVERIKTYTTTISDFLKKNPKPYTHYILLDHQDWLAANDLEALSEEWTLILKNSRPGTKILLRSGAMKIDFFPDFVLERVKFEPSDALKTEHFNDRVGTYGSVYCGIVQ